MTTPKYTSVKNKTRTDSTILFKIMIHQSRGITSLSSVAKRNLHTFVFVLKSLLDCFHRISNPLLLAIGGPLYRRVTLSPPGVFGALRVSYLPGCALTRMFRLLRKKARLVITRVDERPLSHSHILTVNVLDFTAQCKRSILMLRKTQKKGVSLLRCCITAKTGKRYVEVEATLN